MSNISQPQLSLSAQAARNLATATVTVPQNSEITPRWFLRLLPWVDIDGGVYRVNRRKIIIPRSARISVHQDKVDATSLRSIPFLSHLDQGALETIANLFAVEKAQGGQILGSEGDAAGKFLIVAQGKIELSIIGPHGDKLRQSILAEGSFFGEEALLDGSLKTPTLKALTPSTILSLDRNKFEELLGRDAHIRETIHATIDENKKLAGEANEFGETKIDLLASHRGEPKLPTTFVDYDADPREYHLSTIQTVLHTHTRVTDLYSNKIDQLREQIRLTVEAVKEKEEWELINNPDFGLLHEVDPAHRITTRSGAPTPDDLDDLLSLVWKKPAFFLAHPKAIAAFGRECTRRGVPPPTVQLFGTPFITWRGVPLVPCDKLLLNGHSTIGSGLGSTSILLVRVGEGEQGVVGLQKTGVTGEVEPGLSVRYMGTNENSIASHLVTRYFSAAVLTEDAIARLDNVLVGRYHDYV